MLRVSGKVDGVRLPKPIYYVSRVMQNEKPDLAIIGHWNYPSDTKKTVFVAASHCDKVELFLNGKSIGVQTKTADFVDALNPNVKLDDPNTGIPTGFIYAFPNVAFVPGTIKAIATKAGEIVAQQEIETAGEATAIKLTVRTGPQGFMADGSDVALIDFEVVDAKGRRVPTEEARVDFTVTGPTVWRGGGSSSRPASSSTATGSRSATTCR